MDFKPVLFDDIIEAVVTDTILLTEALDVHQPQLVPTYAGILLADILDELHYKRFHRQALHQMVFMLVIGLLAHTK